MRIVNYILLLLILVCQIRLWSSSGGIPQIFNLEEKIAEQQAINADLSERNQQLHAQAESLRNNEQAIEEVARSRQGLIKENETLFIVFDPEDE